MCSFLTGVQSCALPILFSILRSGVLWCRKLAASDQSSLVLSRTLAFARHFGTRGNLLPTSAGLSGLRVTSASIHEALASSDNPSIRTFSADTIRSAPQVRTRSEEHTYELQSLMRISYAVFCLKKKTNNTNIHKIYYTIHI